MNKQTFIVLSLGGSLIAPQEIDVEFLRKFRTLLRQEIRRGSRFMIFTGGGKICRTYQAAAQKLGHPTSEDLDWIGIRATHLNGELLRVLLKPDVATALLTSPYAALDRSARAVFGVGGGYRPGVSSDGPAVTVARRLGAKLVINLTNIPCVYDRDPRHDPRAKKISDLTWREYLRLIQSEWTPGMNVPFDPVAARRAQRAKISVAIADGRNLPNVRNILRGRPFDGTLIHP